jgi:glycosyltransferase involved in cell wall biosynthesis
VTFLLGLFTEVGGRGGVQAVSAQLARRLAGHAQASSTEANLLALNDAAGRPHQALDMVRGYGRNWLAFALAALFSGLRASSIWVAHVNLAPLAWLLALLRPRLRYVLLAHGVEVWTARSMLQIAALRRADRVVAVSAYTARKLELVHGVSAAKIVVIPNMLADDLPAAPTASANPNLILSVSRLDRDDAYKGIDQLLRALALVRESRPEAHCVIVGAGNDRARLETLAHQLQLEAHVKFAGAVSAAELKALYDECAVFCLPSRAEGFGIVFLEAMAHARPVVALRMAATPEVVEDEVTGVLAADADPHQLGGALLRLLRDPDLCRRMGAAGRARVKAQYLPNVVEPQWQALLQELA